MSMCTHLSRRWLNIPVYKGPFVVKKTKPWEQKTYKHEIEEMYDKIRERQKCELTEASPFHVIWRTKHLFELKRREKLICRKLGIHSLRGKEPMIVPNTPHYNQLLWEVKHIINLRPVTFPDGLPTEKDIGRAKLNHFTGEFRLDDRYRVPESRLIGDNVNPIYEGLYLRDYLKKLAGIFTMATRN